ncbi:MAG: insulinase family protein [Bacteroidota bacterium]|nr:insulinase family protein [Bacteroidota bacterium]
MKKLLLILAVLGLAATTALRAQDMEEANRYMLQNLPNDPAVRVGHLDNGLTYFLLHNALPEKRAEFYLATNVGGIQETPDQDGLAHFLEHMCFNGTEHFPGKGILDYLRSIGAEFGRNINASTGFEETQYMLNNIPVERPTVVDTCLMILADYSHFVLNETDEIDAERGVIIEERRARRTADWRILERSLPYWFGDCKYATCTLIGLQESLETFKPESLHNFYKTWYYPGNQAVVVVGDIDVDRTEQKIKDIFGPIPANPAPQAKDVIVPPAHEEPVVGVLTDPELTSASVMLLWMGQAAPEEYNPTRAMLLNNLLQGIVAQIASERFNDITSDPDSPYQSGSFGIGGDIIYENTDAVFGEVTLKEDRIMEGYKAFVEEIERLIRFGVTDDEVDRAKTNILNSYDERVKRAATRKNAEFIRPILGYFFDKKPYMVPEEAYREVEQLLQNFNGQIVSMMLQQIPMVETNNFTILYTGPEKAGIATPTEAELLSAYREVKASDIKAGEQNAVAESFLDPETLAGAQVEKTRGILYGTTEWTLANGIKVYVKPTKFAENQILLDIFENGGTSLIPEGDMASFNNTILQIFSNNSGISQFSGTEVSKMLAGKTLSVMPYFGGFKHGVSGRSSIKDLETALQIVYLLYTDPRFDEKEWNNGINQLSSLLPNMEKTPDFILGQRLSKLLYDSPRHEQISMDVVKKADLKVYEKNYRKLFGDATGAKMTIVGDVDLETLKPLVEKYIGSLPTGKSASQWEKTDKGIVSGKVTDDYLVDMTTPQTTVVNVYSLETRYDERTAAALEIVQYILDMRYVTSLREEEGGTYGASTVTALQRRPAGKALIQTYFNCNPAKADLLRELAVKGITELANEGPTDEEFSQAILNLKKNLPENRISNNYWANQIENWIDYAEDSDTLRETALLLVTKDDVKNITKAIIESGNFIELVQRPTKDVE